MTLGEHILKYRKLKGLSQEELGKLLHVSRQTISKWESNQSSPDIQSCKEMAKIFDISLQGDDFGRGKVLDFGKIIIKNKINVYSLLPW